MRIVVRCLLALCCVSAGLGWILPPPAAAQKPPPAPAQNPPAPPPPAAGKPGDEKLITMDFQDVDLPVLVKFISDITGKNFIVDDRVKGKVTVISPSKISVDEAYMVFQSVLQVKGFTTVPSGVITKIVSTKEAKTSTLRTVEQASTLPNDEYITRLVPLKKVDANSIVAIVQPLVSPDGLLAVYDPTNTIILIDTAANTERLRRILYQLDVPGLERKVEVIRLTHAFADDVASKIGEVLEEQAPGGGAPGAAPVAPVAARSARARAAAARRGANATAQVAGGTGEQSFKVVPEERTNSLIVIAPPVEMEKIKELISQLDVPLPLGTGRIHVYYLRHANSQELVAVLGSLIGGGGGGGIGGLGGFGGSGGFNRGGLGGSSFGRGGGGSSFGSRSGFGGNSGFGSSSGFGGSSGSSFGSSSRGQSLGGRGSTLGGLGTPGGFAGGSVGTGGNPQQQFFEGEVHITADPATNSLIIDASPQDFETIKDVIEKLDVRRRQVYVEAIILEVDLDRSRQLGFTFQGATGLGPGVGLGRYNFTQTAVGPAVSQFSVPGLILAAASSQTIRLPDGSTVPAQAALLNALQTDSDFNILSAPNLLTTDNQEAEIVSGRNLPFLASRSTSETNLANTFATIERRDVGITLRITPQISEGGTVRLDIFQEVSDITDVAGIDPNAVGPATTIRSTTTTVVARDGQTVVIGGLISDTIRSSESKIPFLGDIPVLGNLVKDRTTSRNKINLLIFLTPHIVRNEYDQERFSKIERNKMQGFMDDQHIPNKRRDVLNRPSWDVDSLPAPPKPGERGGRLVDELPSAAAADETSAQRAAQPGEERPAVPPEPDSFGSPESMRPQDSIPPSQYVLLASIWEAGQPPSSLESINGLLPIVLPLDSQLTRFFRPGQQYRFQSDSFAAVYRCLAAFPTASAAFALYPEGMHVSEQPREFLHWLELQDAMARNVVAWTRVD